MKKNIRTSPNSRKNSGGAKRQYVSRRSEVYGIIIIVISVLLFFSFFKFGKPGIVTDIIDDFLSYVFGFTKYIFAFLLFVWGISFFIKRIKYLPSRFGWGFVVIYIAAAGLISSNFKYTNIFDPVFVKSRGGVIGAGIYYGLYRLVGNAGAITILSALAVIGILIITRLSIIDLAKKISRNRAEANSVKSIIIDKGELSRKNNISGKTAVLDFNNRADSKNSVSMKTPRYLKKEAPEVHGQPRAPDVVSFEERSNSKRVFDAEKVMGQANHKIPEPRAGDTASNLQNIKNGVPDENFKDARPVKQGQLKMIIEQEESPDENYKLPPLSILKKSDTLSPKLYKKNVSENVTTLNQLFYYFNLPAKITSVTRGPSITLYEVTLSQGVKVSKLLSLEDDFCVALGSPDIRFLTPIPGKSAIGIEVPNKVRSLVTLGDIMAPSDKALWEDSLTVPLGKNFSGEVVHMTINNMPHVLIAGATNSGKSVCLNSLIVALLMKVKPSEVRMIMIDPKMVELSMYNGIPHLLAPVIVDPRKAAHVLSWVLEEMKNRFSMLLDYNCKALEEFNFMAKRDAGKDSDLKPLPYILVVIDELADLMMVAAAEVEDSICRLAQMARAVGIHLIISTQKPVVKILTGLIKTNIPARIAFRVTDYTDSRVILEHAGAEKLIGKGDMLYLSPQANRPERLQGAFVTTKEISMITNYIKSQVKAEYNSEITERFSKKEERALEDDELLYDALRVVVEIGHASASLLQRKLRLGYSRAARIIDQLEEKGFVGNYDGSKPREVLVSRDELNEMLGGEQN
ncbi:MAG: DNA translocase FtsK [Actinobacteria bacterium]|nr:DNA translocase FtsK [Actinomycetota bacterium]